MVDAARYHHVHAPSRHAPSPDAVQPPIVFVHGLKGSTLTDEQGNVVYGPSLALVFGVSNPPLGLPLAWSADKGQVTNKSRRAPLLHCTFVVTTVVTLLGAGA